MNRTKLTAIAIIAASALSALCLTIWFLFFAQPGRTSHERYVRDDTVFRLMLQPALEQRYISSLTSGITKYISGVPRVSSMQSRAFRVDGIHTLPYEITLLVQEPDAGQRDALLFMNTLPKNEGLLHEMNRPGFFGRLGFVQWDAPNFDQVSEQEYVANGVLLDTTEAAALRMPALEGDHCLELTANNDSAVLDVLHRHLLSAEGYFIDGTMHDYLTEAWPTISSLHVTADLQAADLISIKMKIGAAPTADPPALASTLDAATSILADWLESRGEVRLDGGWSIAGPRGVDGNFKLSGFEKHLRRVLGT